MLGLSSLREAKDRVLLRWRTSARMGSLLLSNAAIFLDIQDCKRSPSRERGLLKVCAGGPGGCKQGEEVQGVQGRV